MSRYQASQMSSSSSVLKYDSIRALFQHKGLLF